MLKSSLVATSNKKMDIATLQTLTKETHNRLFSEIINSDRVRRVSDKPGHYKVDELDRELRIRKQSVIKKDVTVTHLDAFLESLARLKKDEDVYSYYLTLDNKHVFLYFNSNNELIDYFILDPRGS